MNGSVSGARVVLDWSRLLGFSTLVGAWTSHDSTASRNILNATKVGQKETIENTSKVGQKDRITNSAKVGQKNLITNSAKVGGKNPPPPQN